MNPTDLLDHLSTRRDAMLAGLRALVEHESPSRDKAALDALAERGPGVTIFGSARTEPGEPEYLAAVEVARRLARAGFAIITFTRLRTRTAAAELDDVASAFAVMVDRDHFINVYF